MEINHKWDNRFRDMCSEIARWSSCLSRHVGAILVRDKTIIATGYNGPPRGIPHCGHERFMSDWSLRSTISNKGLCANPLRFRDECPRKVLGYASGKGLDICPAIHAEDNCISNAARTGVITIGSTMYMNCGVPCKDCLKKIINAGIVEIVCTSMTLYDELSDWLMKESNIIVRIYGEER